MRNGPPEGYPAADTVEIETANVRVCPCSGRRICHSAEDWSVEFGAMFEVWGRWLRGTGLVMNHYWRANYHSTRRAFDKQTFIFPEEEELAATSRGCWFQEA